MARVTEGGQPRRLGRLGAVLVVGLGVLAAVGGVILTQVPPPIPQLKVAYLVVGGFTMVYAPVWALVFAVTVWRRTELDRR